MIYKWESSKAKLLKSMSVPPKQKMEWLREINEFLDKYTPAKTKKMKRALRNARSLGGFDKTLNSGF